MFNIVKKEIEWCGKTLTLETGKIARQADGAVIVTYGETSVLCTAVMKRDVVEGTDYFPLNVHYKEMFSAAGKIPGGFFKREGRLSDREVVTSRLMDRPLRPLFPEGFYNEVQILCSVISYDGETSADIPAVIAASAALAISGIPFLGPIGAIKVALEDDKFVLNPSVVKEGDKPSRLDLVVSGTKDAILMVEALAHELSEDQMMEAIDLAHKSYQPVIKLIESFKKAVGKPALKAELVTFDSALEKKVTAIADKELAKLFKIADKKEREEKVKALRDKVFDEINPEDHLKQSVSSIFKSLKEKIVRKNILKNSRIDGRDVKTIRPITSEVSILPRTHGSALFTRGETQALVVTTLGGPQDAQIIDAMDADTKERFLLHYSFPPYSVGETGPQRGPGRREVGHGKLAWKAISPMLPSQDDFPYTIRVVSEITESNGSSSMATVCGTTLALMDAGVPLKSPVAGIAMGLVKEGKEFKVLSDILGDEDSLGDMDFKVAGTANGITALQMDIKVLGISREIMETALNQAREGRLSILKTIAKALDVPRKGISKFAPSIVKLTINKEKIGAVVGPGGKVIKEICAKTGAKIDIDDNGVVSVTAVGKEATDEAVKMITDIAIEPELGKIYEGVVKQILDFGAVVSFLNREGLLHISEISHERVKSVHDELKVSEKIKVKLVEADQFKGKYRLSIKDITPAAKQATDKKAERNEDATVIEASADSESEEVNYNREGTSYENGDGARNNSNFKRRPRGGAGGKWNRGGDRSGRPNDGRQNGRFDSRSNGGRSEDGRRPFGDRNNRGDRNERNDRGPKGRSGFDRGSHRSENKKKYFNI
jgi:polyribonucleotide nucleotidyltransferase